MAFIKSCSRPLSTNHAQSQTKETEKKEKKRRKRDDLTKTTPFHTKKKQRMILTHATTN